MELSLLLGEEIVSLFLMAVIGYLVVKVGLLRAADSKVLSMLVVYVFSPCVILSSFQISYSKDKMAGLVLVLLVAISIQATFIFLVWLLSKVWKMNTIEKASLIYTNSGYLVTPIVAGVMGEEWLFYVAVYSVAFQLLVWTHGMSLISNRRESNVKKIMMNPNIIACLVGVFVFILQFEFPVVIGNSVTGLGRMVGPASIMAIGMLVGNIDLKKAFKNKRIYVICFLRLILLPAIIILAFKLLGVTSFHEQGKEVIRITLLAAAAPVATVVAQIAQVYDEDAQYAGLINAVSVILCIVTMPIMVLLYELIM